MDASFRLPSLFAESGVATPPLIIVCMAFGARLVAERQENGVFADLSDFLKRLPREAAAGRVRPRQG